MCSLKEEIKGA